MLSLATATATLWIIIKGIKLIDWYDLEIEWIRGMWADCANVGSPVSLGLFEGDNKSKYFQKSLPQLGM